MILYVRNAHIFSQRVYLREPQIISKFKKMLLAAFVMKDINAEIIRVSIYIAIEKPKVAGCGGTPL